MKWTPIVAMLCIVALEAFAIEKGMDGAMLGIAVAVIGGLGGYELKVLRDKAKGGK